MPRKPRSEPPAVVRRSDGRGRRRLDPEVEALARGDIDTLPQRRRRPRVDDPRAVALVPGVANRDARLASSRRLQRLREAVARRAEATTEEARRQAEQHLGDLLAEAVRLGLWRGLAVASFEALTEDLLELPAPEARALAEEGAARLGFPLVRASEETIALWLRTEAALLQLGCEEAAVRCTGEGEQERLHLAVPLERAPSCLKEIGWKVAPLAPGHEGGPRRPSPPHGTRRPVVVEAAPRSRRGGGEPESR